MNLLNSIFANVIAGLGLFFSGLKMLDTNLRQATGRQLRAIIGRLTRRSWIAGLVGVISGALVPSSSGILFILVSLTTSGLTTIEQALPLITWTNVGCCALIFATVIDLRLMILYLIGLAGAAFAFDRSHTKSVAIGAIFGMGMLFYGIELMKSGVEPLKDLPLLSHVLSGNHYIIAFIASIAFAFVTQSSTAVSILVIGLAQRGLLGPFQAMTALYGANVGSTFARMLLSSTLTGSVKQLTAFQDLFKGTGSTLFMVMLYLEASLGVPLVHAFVSHLSSKPDRQMAFVYLLLNISMALLFSIFQGSILRLLQWWLPGDDTENLSKPQFLYYEALEEPATALDLIEREQLRLIKALITYTQAMRAGPQTAEHQSATRIHQQFGNIANHIDQFQHELTSKQLGAQELERITRLQGRLSLIVYLEDNLRALFTSAETIPKNGPLADLFSTFTESLDFLLLTVIDALEGNDPGIVEMLSGMTSERGELVESIRKDFLAEESAAPAERAVLFEVTSLFERIVWMTNRLSRLMNGGFSKAKPLANA